MRITRSILAIFLGFLTVLVASTLFAIVVGVISRGHPNTIAIEFAMLFGALAGGGVTAVIAPDRGVLHAAVLSFIIMITAIAGVLTEHSRTPAWYELSVAIVTAAGIVIGAMLVGTRPAPPIA